MASKANSIARATGVDWLPCAALALARVHELGITAHAVTGKSFNDGHGDSAEAGERWRPFWKTLLGQVTLADG